MKRYTVQTAIAEKVTDLLRVSLNLSLKRFVTNEVTLPSPWCPVEKQDDFLLQPEDDEDKELQEDDDDMDPELKEAIQMSLLHEEQRIAAANQDIDMGTVSIVTPRKHIPTPICFYFKSYFLGSFYIGEPINVFDNLYCSIICKWNSLSFLNLVV